MERSESDRFIGGSSEDVSAEVYVSVRDDARRGGASGWRYIAVATGILALALALVVASLAAGGSHPASRPAAPVSSCVDAPGYGGLGGRVRADSSTPPLTARELLVLVSRPYLPADAKQLVNTDRCAGWESAALKRATGRAFAQATAFSQAANPVGRAEIEATSTLTC